MSHPPISEDSGATVSGRYRAVGVTFDDLVTGDPVMRARLDQASRLAGVDVAILIEGETGTGKNLLAQAIHNAGLRRRAPYVEVTCGAIPETLAESELFGHVAGAFTGAIKDQKGWFERANGGTIFLDEIGDLPIATQAKLLRVVERGEFIPVGAGAARHATTRIIAATSRNLEEEVDRGRFRRDLYHRLSEIRLELPPLRARKCDIEALVHRFLGEWNAKYVRALRGLEPPAMRALEEHDWPGNVRELRAVVRRGAALAKGAHVTLLDLELRVKKIADACGSPAAGDLSIATAERMHIERVLRLTDGNKSRAAALLGIARNTLDRKIQEYRIAIDAADAAAPE